MFNRLRIMFERYQARRELRRKGIINPRRLVDWDSFANTIDRSPAPAVFILVMVWVVSSVLMTLSALQQNIDPGWVIGQEATRTLHSSCDLFSDFIISGTAGFTINRNGSVIKA